MNSTTLPEPAEVKRTDARGLQLLGIWLAGGWRLFRRAPLRLFGLMLLLFTIEGLTQWFVPLVGIPFSKWLVGILSSVLWLVLVQVNDCGQLRLGRAFRGVGGQWPAVAGLAGVLMLAYAMQVACAYLIMGPAAIDLLVFAEASSAPSGTAPSLNQFQLALVLSSGIPLSTLLMFAAPLVLIQRQRLIQALGFSVRMVVQNLTAMTLLALLMITLIFLVPFTFMLSVLLTGPWLICVSFVAFQTLHARHDPKPFDG